MFYVIYVVIRVISKRFWVRFPICGQKKKTALAAGEATLSANDKYTSVGSGNHYYDLSFPA